eukprot:NODE_414_length_7911_cov_0.926011.p5 type:complete len:222 gc:universal NODE_414_length_7911_cov_0.926011:5774-5109(-)
MNWPLILSAIYGKIMNPYALYISLYLLNTSKIIDLFIIHVSILFCISLDISHFIEKSFDEHHPEQEHAMYHVILTIFISIYSMMQSKKQGMKIMGVPVQLSVILSVIVSACHLLSIVLQEHSLLIVVLGVIAHFSWQILEKCLDVILNRIHSFHPIHDHIQHQIQLFTNYYHVPLQLIKINRYGLNQVAVFLQVNEMKDEYLQYFNKWIKVGEDQLEFRIS